jgi:hypothetical protein
MRKRKITSTLLLIFVLLTVATITGALRNQNRSQVSTGDESYAPVTDFTASRPHDAKRKAKGLRYKIQPTPIEETESNATPLPVISHWWRGLSSLPVDVSDVIVRGEVTNAQAHLSEDGTGIYSEFTLKINEVFKGGSDSVSLDQEIVAERIGGAVRFPSGKVQRYSVAEQGMPRPGREYVIFLRRSTEDGDFNIITGYELQGGHVTPLDGGGSSSRSGAQDQLPFAVYKNSDEASLLNALRVSVAQSSQLGRRSD